MWDLLSFVLRSKQRQQILLTLKQPTTPTQIAKETGLAVSHVSRTLKEFTERGLIECKTPSERVGKIYALTEKGRKVLENILYKNP